MFCNETALLRMSLSRFVELKRCLNFLMWIPVPSLTYLMIPRRL